MNDDEAYEFYADPANLELAGPGRKRKGQRLTSMTAVRFAPEVIEAVKERAFGEGVTVGSWIRRLVGREFDTPRVTELAVEGFAEPLRIPAGALEQVVSALLPVLIRHGQVDLRIGAGRPVGLIEGSGRAGVPRTLGTSLSGTGRSFSCGHLSVGNVTHAACGICGPLTAVAA
jgi:hypothetical protein